VYRTGHNVSLRNRKTPSYCFVESAMGAATAVAAAYLRPQSKDASINRKD